MLAKCAGGKSDNQTVGAKVNCREGNSPDQK
uniref:Uncharacterized protein n=1 Tax=Amphimedon queenslandica TaxID=400682 RepID=A0A1X7UF09_AMPQE